MNKRIAIENNSFNAERVPKPSGYGHGLSDGPSAKPQRNEEPIRLARDDAEDPSDAANGPHAEPKSQEEPEKNISAWANQNADVEWCFGYINAAADHKGKTSNG